MHIVRNRNLYGLNIVLPVLFKNSVLSACDLLKYSRYNSTVWFSDAYFQNMFSRALHALTGIELFYLDMMYWNADKTTVEKSVSLEHLSAVLEKYGDKNIITFMSREQANEFLLQI